jgi:hypothetical protein
MHDLKKKESHFVNRRDMSVFISHLVFSPVESEGVDEADAVE